MLFYTEREAGAAFAPGFEPFCESGFSALAYNLTSDRFEMRCAAAPDGSLTGKTCNRVQEPSSALEAGRLAWEQDRREEGRQQEQLGATAVQEGAPGQVRARTLPSRWTESFALGLRRQQWPIPSSVLRDATATQWYRCEIATDGQLRWRLPLSASVPLLQT